MRPGGDQQHRVDWLQSRCHICIKKHLLCAWFCLGVMTNTRETQNLPSTFQRHTASPQRVGAPGLFLCFLVASMQSSPPLGFRKSSLCARRAGLKPGVCCLLSPALSSMQPRLCFFTALQPLARASAFGHTPGCGLPVLRPPTAIASWPPSHPDLGGLRPEGSVCPFSATGCGGPWPSPQSLHQ